MEKFVPVVVIKELEETERILTALRANGINCAEITFRTACAAEAISLACKLFPDMSVGAGTVINAEQCEAALKAGAQFIVSPGLSVAVANICNERNIPYYPGCVTPTEIMQALELGITTVKFFPANIYGGLKALKALSAPFPQVKFIPTGGVDRSNIDEFLAFDKVEAIGGSFFVKESLDKMEGNKMEKISSFGEIMLRLAPNGYYRFFQNDQMQATFGGGEANVAVSLANYGMDSVYVTKLPKHAIGQAAVDSLRYFGVDTSKIIRGGERVGIYFLEKGASQRGSVCIYDRAYSAIQMAKPEDFNWDEIFEGADWFHFTGITPALGQILVEICKEACKAAKAKGVKISCDLNYRGKLWTREQAREAMTELCQYVDVCISNEEDAKDVFGIEAEGTDIYGGKLNHEGYKSVAKQLADKFGFEKVAITLRTSISASDNDWAGMLYDGEDYYFSKSYHLHIVDRVGGGDSFGGGLIYSILSGKTSQETIEFAVAASALKHSVEGDYNRVSVNEVEKLAGGDGSGRVQR